VSFDRILERLYGNVPTFPSIVRQGQEGRSQGGSFRDQLQELKSQNVILDVLYDMADAIRKKGNIGAHPGRDPVVNQAVSATEARAVFGIVEQVFRYVYEFSDEVSRLKGP
jgi:hypothetical protein